ncbi:MAG: hypothetical protein ACJ76F_05010 [Bacteroidia bacterium]
MGLFSSLFGKKKPFSIHNRVWADEKVKDNMLADHLKSAEKSILLVSFFEETHSRMEIFSSAHVKSLRASDIVQRRKDAELKTWLSQPDQELIFAEHFPFFSEEELVLQYLADLSGAQVSADFYISLDDPIIVAVSGDKVKSLMQRMGVDPEEMIRHSMIDSSIQKAQEKIQEKVAVAVKANSLKEWFRLNLGNNL